MSPDTRQPSTKKHWLPGVWPGVWINVMGISPTITVSPLVWVVRWASVIAGGSGDPRHFVDLDVDRDLHFVE